MAVDTAQKRYSMLGLAAPARALFPPPDGGFTTQADRQQLIYLYSGIAASEPEILIPPITDFTLDFDHTRNFTLDFDHTRNFTLDF